MLRFLIVCLALSPAAVTAGDNAFSGTVALVSTGVDRPYLDARADHSLAPLIVGRWRNVFFAGNRIALGLHQGDGWSLAALANLRLHQYTDDRDRAIEFGAVVTVPFGSVDLQAAVVHDVTGTHGGMEFELRAFTTLRAGRVTLVPAVALQRQDDDLAGYYFGAPAMTNVLVEAYAELAVNDDWTLVGSARHFEHGEGVGRTLAWALGIGRHF